MKQLTLEEIAKLTGAELIGDPRHVITGIADIETALSCEASFIGNSRYLKKLPLSKAGAIFIHPSTSRTTAHNFLLHKDPTRALQLLADTLFEEELQETAFQGIHPTAVIHSTAKLGNSVTVGPHAVIDGDVTIGEGSFIGAGCYIGFKSRLGKECHLYPHVTIRERCFIGDRVILHPHVVIGLCGFGFSQTPTGHQKLKHYGTVVIGNDVEIGAGTTIARARFEKTVIGDGTKIDCQVEIAHNVQVGKHVLIVGQCGIAGSTKIADAVMIGGKVAIDGHLEICSGAMIRAFSGVTKSITTPGAYGGLPAQPLQDENRTAVQLRNIDKLIKRVEKLEETKNP